MFKIEAKTGYDLEWKIFKTGEPIEQLANILLVSNDAPDQFKWIPLPALQAMLVTADLLI